MRRWYCGVPGGPRGAAACAAVCQRGLWSTAPTEMNAHNAGNLLGPSVSGRTASGRASERSGRELVGDGSATLGILLASVLQAASKVGISFGIALAPIARTPAREKLCVAYFIRTVPRCKLTIAAAVSVRPRLGTVSQTAKRRHARRGRRRRSIRNS